MYRPSARTIRDEFCKKKITAKQIAEKTLEQINLYDQKIGAFLSILEERMLLKAAELDRKRDSGKPLGALAGVPISIKDNIHIQGEKTTCASKFLENYKAVFDATVVRLLEEEDALIIGKTNLDEFAMGSTTENSAYQLTKNPWNLKCTPGGSSGGSAASVAARFCPISLGTDTGGSIRQPAAFCGIVGFKPTYGRVSRYGLVSFGSSLDQIGPLAYDVKDAALCMQVIGKHCPHDSTSIKSPAEHYLKKLDKPIHGETIGIPYSCLSELDSGSKEHFLEAINVFKKLGATIVDVDLNLLKYAIAVYYILATAEASTNLARFDGIRYGKRAQEAKTLEEIYVLSRQEGFGAEVKKRILLGTYVLSSGYQDEYCKKAQKVRTLLIQMFQEAFTKCSIIAMPTSPLTSFPLGKFQDPVQLYLQDIFTVSANLAGLPAISVPNGFSDENLPYGLQLIGPYMHDANVLRFGYAFESATPHTNLVPPLFDNEVQ
jgi:aspartyl-tRNA(Asn)/glutamyl-tRNA(Gln) amidotransferase subunit A